MKKFAHSAARWAFLALLLLLLTSMALSARAEVVTTSSSIASPSPIQQARTRGSSADGNSNRFITRKEQRRRRHQRRAMEHYQQQRRRRHSYHYPSSYQQQQEKDSQSKNYHRTTRAPASLSDVFLCYVFALGWSVWFLSSFLNTDLMRYAQNNSVLVHGNVREVSIETDSLGTGIPTYHALIDYIITVRRERDESKIQVRKSFQTQHLLQQGFANVELLVLPEEPTSSVLKEDWEREVAAQEQAEEDLVSIGAFEDIGIFGGDASHGETGTSSRQTWDKGDSTPTAFSKIDIWAKRVSLFFSATLVTASLIGAVQTVHRIPNEGEQLVGWIAVVIGACCLWPLSMFVLNVVSTCQRLGSLPSEKSGIILKCDTNAQIGTTINDTRHYKQHHDPDMANGRHLDKVGHEGLFNHLKTPKQGNTTTGQGDNSNRDTIMQTNALDQSISSDDSACYFVKLPSNKDGTKKNLDDSSMSTISANSTISKHGKRNSMST